jgi:hypothetical protein
MNTNTSSTTSSTSRPDRLAALTAAIDDLAAQDSDGLPDAVRAAEVLRRRLVDRLEGHWLHQLAGVDARGAAGPTKTTGRVDRRLAAQPAAAAPRCCGQFGSDRPGLVRQPLPGTRPTP